MVHECAGGGSHAEAAALTPEEADTFARKAGSRSRRQTGHKSYNFPQATMPREKRRQRPQRRATQGAPHCSSGRTRRRSDRDECLFHFIFLFALAGLSRTPGPPPFSAMNSTPADSRAHGCRFRARCAGAARCHARRHAPRPGIGWRRVHPREWRRGWREA